MEKKIRELTEFAADHEIMIQNMNRRLTILENVGLIFAASSIISMVGLIVVLSKIFW